MEFRVSQKWKSVSSNVNLQQLKDKQEVWKWLAPRISPRRWWGRGVRACAPVRPAKSALAKYAGGD